jgi:hypothetical protein
MRIPSRAAPFLLTLAALPLHGAFSWSTPAHAVAPAVGLAVQDVGQDAAYTAAKARYETCMRRLPLEMHARGWQALAATRDIRGMEILAQTYTKPSDPREQVRNLVVGIAAPQFNAEQFVDRWIQWRTENATARDSYLWYRALLIECRNRGPEGLVAIATDDALDVYLRAAAVRALADTRAPVVTDLVAGLCLAMPAKEEHRATLASAIGAALLSQKSALADDAYQKAAESYALLLDAEHKLSESAKITVARYLGQCLGVDQLYLESGLWIQKIKAKGAVADAPKSSGAGATVTKPSFFGLETDGTNIVYVIDMSDSMCKLIDHNLKPKGPTTGGASSKKKRKKGDIPTVDDIPWDRVNNRFDLAREHLKISLQRLDKDKRFSIVFFGDRANLIDATPGMMEATPQNVSRAMKELDAIIPGPPTTDRPDGTLRGMTNMHGGLRRAFQVRGRGLAEGDEHVDGRAMIEGADTIFLLSDGDPTWDDWDKVDTNYGEDNAGDPESGVAHQQLPNMHYTGPYARRENLLPDVTRMNLFRSVEIHCIAIGEVDVSILQEISRIGLNGKTHVVK